MNRTSWTLLCVLALGACETPRVPTGGDFTYELPAFNVKLKAPNFEYVQLGVTGSAKMGPLRDQMYERRAIGLVNRALTELYGNVSFKGGAYALVNVVTDIATTSIFDGTRDSNGMVLNERLRSREPETLTIRADVVHFTEVVLDKPVTALGAGTYPLTGEGQQALEQHLQRQLASR